MSLVAQTATLVHGYTMADVDRAARVAVAKHTRSVMLDREDREAAAWHAIVVELYECGCGVDPEHCTRGELPLTFFDLLFAAYRALDEEAKAVRHHEGWTVADTTRRAARPGQEAPEPTHAPRFTQYWLPVKYDRSDGFSDRICEAMALRDSLGVLTGEQYEALATLAAFDNAVGPAAEALGMKYHGFYYRVASAREKIKAVWFGEETPVESKPTGDTCRVGHSRAEHGYRSTSTGMWECRACRRATARRRNAKGRGDIAS